MNNHSTPDIDAQTTLAWEIFGWLGASACLTGALIAVYGWLLGPIFAAFILAGYFLVKMRVTR